MDGGIDQQLLQKKGFCGVYIYYKVMNNVGGVDEKTFREWAWFILEAFADRQAEVVSF